MSSTVCNNDCICINCDCSYFHPIPYKDRKIVFKIYSNLTNISKTETNPEKRKANCSNGKLCIRANCGYRHRLSFNDRLKLNEEFEKSKIQTIKEVKEKPKKEIKNFEIKTSNLFADLLDELSEIPPVPEIKTGFKDAVLKWSDMCDSDDDFYMKF